MNLVKLFKPTEAQETDHSFDPVTGIESIIHPTPEGGFIYEEKQNVDDILDVNKALYNETRSRDRYGEGPVRVASLPLVIFMQLKRSGILQDKQRFLKWLDQPENQAFRTRPGRLA